MRLVNLSLTALLSVFVSGWVQAQSLPEAVAIALSQYPTILAAQANQQAAEFEVTRAQERLKVADQQVSHGAKTVTGYWQQYQVSRRQIHELLNIQNELFTLQVNKISARFDILNFRIVVLANLGRLAKDYSLLMHKA